MNIETTRSNESNESEGMFEDVKTPSKHCEKVRTFNTQNVSCSPMQAANRIKERLERALKRVQSLIIERLSLMPHRERLSVALVPPFANISLVLWVL